MKNKKFKLSDVTLSTWIRTGLMLLAMVNFGLQLAGKHILPINNKDVEQWVSFAFAVITSIAAWWKNNSFTEPAQQADEIIKKK